SCLLVPLSQSVLHALCLRVSLLFFFFQAEDGIRDFHVTGVQTCALPICPTSCSQMQVNGSTRCPTHALACTLVQPRIQPLVTTRSEERREGKSVDLGGRRLSKKKRKTDERGEARVQDTTRRGKDIQAHKE